jgi:hypothetical protein
MKKLLLFFNVLIFSFLIAKAQEPQKKVPDLPFEVFVNNTSLREMKLYKKASSNTVKFLSDYLKVDSRNLDAFDAFRKEYGIRVIKGNYYVSCHLQLKNLDCINDIKKLEGELYNKNHLLTIANLPLKNLESIILLDCVEQIEI